MGGCPGFLGFLWDFSCNPTAIFKQGGSFLYFLGGYLLRICGSGIVSDMIYIFFYIYSYYCKTY